MSKKIETPKQEPESSFVRLENANMLKLTLRQLAKLYTQYAKTVLDVNEVKDRKMEVRKELFAKINDIEQNFKAMLKILPKAPEPEKVVHGKIQYPVEKQPAVEYDYGDAFSNLKKEFEGIRSELEKMM